MAWYLPCLSIWHRIAPIPPSIEFVPVDASTIRAYVLSALGYAMIGSEHSNVFKVSNASKGLPVIGPFVYSESLRVALFSGSQILLKFLMWVLKKLHNPTKDLISSFVVGIFAFSTAFSLSLPGFMPSGVNLNPR